MSTRELITEHLDLWTGAVTKKASSGRGTNGKVELTGVKKLRELILELAVRGKLVDQDPEDQPAHCLIEQIEATKAKSRRKGRSSKMAPVEDHEKYFLLPSNWEWVRLGTIQEFTNGYAFKSSQFRDSGVGVIRIGDVSRDGKVTPKDMRYLPVDLAEDVPPQFFVHPQDLVITMTGDVKPGINYTEECFLLNQRVGKLSPYLVSRQFLFLYLKTVAQQKIDNAFGGVIPNVSTREINESVIGLPPLKEQHRIVQKVDELMALCDRLEQQNSDQLEAHETLVDTLLGTLTQSKNATELADNWARLAAHFDTLFTTEQSIDKLKQTILQLAVMGRLVEQDVREEPATVLLEQISKQKAKVTNGGRAKEFPAVTADEKPFALPSGWLFKRLGDLAHVFAGNSFKSQDFNSLSGIRVIKITNVGVGELVETQDFLPPEFANEYSRYLVLAGDLILALTRPYISTGLKVAVCPEDYNQSLLNQRVAAIRPYLDRSFLYKYMQSEYVLGLYQARFGGSGLQPNLKMNDVTNLIIPVPPLAEQHRIVQKVDELMALCDQLKERLNQASETRCQLAEAIVQEAVG